MGGLLGIRWGGDHLTAIEKEGREIRRWGGDSGKKAQRDLPPGGKRMTGVTYSARKAHVRKGGESPN